MLPLPAAVSFSGRDRGTSIAEIRLGLALKSNTLDPTGGYTFFGRNLDVPPGYTAYAKWPILVNNQLYMVATINGNGAVRNAIYAAKYSDPVTRSGSWNLIAVPTKGTGSWEMCQ